MKPVALIILDGWGWREAREANTVRLAQTPNFDRYWATFPQTLLTTSGAAVGLPDGVMGNSEVGHLNIGAGRIVYQDLTRIHRAIASGELRDSPRLQTFFQQVMQSKGTLHVMGLLSDGGVHSHIDHLLALLDYAKAAGVQRVVLHPFLDGRDTSPTGGVEYLRTLQTACDRLGNARIGTLSGRYYAMDRDRRWDRTERAYRAIAEGIGPRVTDPHGAMTQSYTGQVTDEFIPPMVVAVDGKPVGRLTAKDFILFFNFRGDRARQIIRAVADAEFNEFPRSVVLPTGQVLCMRSYHDDFTFPILFPPVLLHDIFGEVVSRAGMRQLRIAETEKYAHVTFFFNGGRDHVSDGEDHCLIQSPKEVATYDLKPEMSAVEVTDVVLGCIERDDYDVIILNFANPDMVGHTGVIDAAIRAVETTDACMGRVVEAIVARGGCVLVTADHGNCEEMRTAEGKPHTAHTTNPVPCMLIGAHVERYRLRDGGILADLAPTLLTLMGLGQPAAMTGRSLLVDQESECDA
ncbi:MAG: 2,3-bisphosphoglycerate-independent phosphoglycerate mutase [Deltaproteobacteria bacterium]|nr:2,3-bisphosphoglycerate-independent phosphoglycerate mutase [Deltaproteobacteria bacterium]